jgi:xyloglucan-specific exo-beta-1,4-glucanase
VNKDRVLAAGSVLVGGKAVMGISRSTDGGLKWTQTKIRDDNYSYATAAALDPSNGNTVYVAGVTASSIPVFYKSTDGGVTWGPIASPSSSPGPVFSSIAIAPDSPKTLYTGGISNQGIYKSTNGGSTWTKIANSPSSSRWIVINPSDTKSSRPEPAFSAAATGGRPGRTSARVFP